ncbi:hypothetical protein PWR63_00965 [Paraburkholderia sp. A2WS-5]|uniref:hypothetical protein n=1 Tax=unclassified Paraburkholderia TaxID=2615204 RepID=UPI003B796C15
MQIDLREIQALHARYAREPVVIDLENQIRAMPAPLLLSHAPTSRPTGLRRAWNARWQIGRVSLTVIGGTVVCAALGMGAARLWPTPHSRAINTPPVPAATPASPQSDASLSAPTPSATAQPLNSQALETSPRGTPGLAAVDPSALIQDHGSLRAPGTAATQPAATTEQKAIVSPIRQRAITGASAAAVANVARVAPVAPVAASTPQAASVEPTAHASAASQAPASQPEAHRPVRHLVHLHLVTPRDMPPAADAQKSAAAPAPRNGDVQLF